jgi:drug/metabolite transporter (DMT)-like permease
MAQGRQGFDAVALLLFVGAVVIGGSNVLAVRFSNQGLPPYWGAGLRFTLAAALFMLLAAAFRIRLPRGTTLTQTALYGLLNFGVFYALGYWAMQYLTAGTTAILLAATPLVTLLLSAAQGLERIRARNVVGALLAIAGIALLALRSGDLDVPLLPVAAILLSTVCIGQSIIFAKRLAHNHPIATNAVGMGTGAVLLLAVSLVAGESWSWPRQTEALAAVLYLVVVGSVVLFVLALLLVRRWSPSATSYMVVLFPVVTPLLEAWLAHVPITSTLVAAAGLVMLGVWFGALAPVRVRTVRR